MPPLHTSQTLAVGGGESAKHASTANNRRLQTLLTLLVSDLVDGIVRLSDPLAAL
jgi:hypothetical protein